MKSKAAAPLFAALLGLLAPVLAAGDGPEGTREEMPISARSDGFVVRIHVREGDKVKEGQVLLEMDPTDHELLLRVAEARIEAAKADIEIGEAARDLARRTFELLEGDAGRAVVTAEEKDRAGFNLKTAEAELRKRLAMLVIAEAETRMVQLQLERCRVLAARDGIVDSVGFQPGEAVSMGDVVFYLIPDAG